MTVFCTTGQRAAALLPTLCLRPRLTQISVSIDVVLFSCFFQMTHAVRGLIGALWLLGDILAAHIAEYLQESIELHTS